MPIAPNPALSLPPMLIKSKKGKSVGFEGTGLNFPFQRTKRGALGSPNTRSSFKPLSTCKHDMINVHCQAANIARESKHNNEVMLTGKKIRARARAHMVTRIDKETRYQV